MARAVGIDLGTTNSVVSVLEAGEPVVIPNAEGPEPPRRWSGSPRTARSLVGEVAKRQAITNPDRTVRSVKRHIGDKDVVDRRRRQEVDAAGDLRADPRQAQARRRGVPRRHGHSGRRHGAARTSTTRSARPPRRPARSPGSRCCGSSTSRRAAALAYGLDKRARPDDPRVRPRRRDVRRLAARDRRGRVRGQGHPRRHAAGRRRLGSARDRLDGQGVQEQPRRSTWRPTGWRCSA